MNILYWFVFSMLLLGLELVYFRMARAFRILDHPNHRNLHVEPTIRGGGVIFLFSAALYFLFYQQPSVYFMAGLVLVSIIGFIDDVRSLSSALRFALQLTSVALMFYGLSLSSPVWVLFVLFVISVAALNAFNFMDGINGITGGYSLVVLGTLAYINRSMISFADQGFLYAVIIGVLIFCLFNFRKKAVCFAGDAGSLSIGFIVISMIVTLITISGNWIYLLLLSVYGADTGLTMIHRMIMKENIFKPHRHHLFQVVVYNTGITHVQMSLIYMLVQLFCNAIVIMVMEQGLIVQVSVVVVQVLALATCYVFIKRSLVVNAIKNGL